MKEKKNSNKQTDATYTRRTEVWLIVLTVIIVGLTLIVALPVMTNWVKTTWVREPDSTIKILNTTYHLPDKAYETTISDSYIIKTEVSSPTQVSALSAVNFLIKYKNIGKTSIEDPYLQVYIIDSLNRVLAEWQGGVNKDKFLKGISFAVDSLTAKGKEIYGKVYIYVLAYDRRTDKTDLVSYLLSSIDIKPRSRFDNITLLIVSMASLTVGLIFLAISTVFLLRQKKTDAKN